MRYQSKQQKYVIGLALRTHNGEGAVTIPAHWERFYRENVLARIPNKKGKEILAVYTDYEGDYTQPYTSILGCEVEHLDEVPEGLVGKVIPEAQYAVLPSEGPFPAGLIAVWNAVWKGDLPRLYTADFEVYPADFHPEHKPQVDVYIAVQHG